MSWKAIGKSVAGTSHIAAGKGCEDALQYRIVNTTNGDILVCCVSDGAGSALYAAEASALCTAFMGDGLVQKIRSGAYVDEADIYALLEELFDKLNEMAAERNCEVYEYACTLLGCCIKEDAALFFQVGDGAIVAHTEGGRYNHIWWPENGEYQNVTSFVINDRNFRDVKIEVRYGQTAEVAIFTDGLQMLTLNNEYREVHQPFFNALFPSLRMANTDDKIAILNSKLEAYLDSRAINDRTDDDKTLFLATRLTQT